MSLTASFILHPKVVPLAGLAEIGVYGMNKQNPLGRKSKLTPETQGRIVQAVLAGYTLASAARMAGIGRQTMFDWLRAFPYFSDAVRAAQKTAATIKIQANPRILARARYEHKETPGELTNLFYAEIMRCRQEGRVPYDVALEALRLAVDELEDKMADESVSWADEPAKAPAHGGHRGRST